MSPTEHIEFAIFNNFLGLDELATMSMINKSYNELAKREIKKIYKIIEIIRSSKIQVNNSSLYSNPMYSEDCNYNQNYWYQLFGRKLNHQELAIYYAYFITKYDISSVNWCCVAFEDGFIKQLGARSDGSVSISHDKPEVYIRLCNYRDENFYIRAEQKYLIDLNPNLLDKKLLKKIINYIFNNAIKTKVFRLINHNIKDAIENLYPILTA
jgi:hypothetical protein